MTQEASPSQVRAGLRAAAAIGPFFALGLDAGSDGQPVARLYRTRPDGPGVLLARGNGPLATAEPRVAASIAQLGYAARLWSPVLGSALLTSVVPDLASLQVVGSQPDAGAPTVLALSELRGWLAADPAQVAKLGYRAVVQAHLEPLARALSGQVAAGLLWGNAASAMAGALGVLVTARPDLRGPATAIAAALLDTGRLRDTGWLPGNAHLPGTSQPEDTGQPEVTARSGVTGGGGLGFRRRSCCLYYRLPGGGLCGDCSLTRPPR
jgi:ferric iron reductase protein FhuF